MEVWIAYVDRTGCQRRRRFRNQSDALNFVTNPPEGVAKFLNAPIDLQAKSSQRAEATHRITGFPIRELDRTEHSKYPPTLIDCKPIRHSWSQKKCRLSEDFDSADEAAVALIERYEQGWAINTLAGEFHMHRDTIKKLLVHNRIPLRTRRFRKLQDARPGWEEAFSKPTAAALYWAGFLMADGSIVRRQGEPAIDCRLALRDIDHIRALCDFVGRGKPITHKAKGQAPLVGWRVISEPMAGDLARWGIVPVKGRLDDTAPKGEARLSIDFWRGMIDGDGSIGMSGRSPQVQLTGRRGISEAFIEFVEANLMLHLLPRYDRTAKRYLRKVRIHEYPEGGATKVILNGKNAVALCELLYANAPHGLYLRRKRGAAIEITQRYLGTAAIEKFL